MDPTQTLSDLLEALATGDRQRSIILLKGLAGWLTGRGFLPDVGCAINMAAEEINMAAINESTRRAS